MLCSNRPTMSFSLNDWRHKACSHSHQTNSKTRQIAAHLTNTFIHARISQLIYDRTMDTSSTKICPSMFGLLILLTVVFGVSEASFFGAPSVGRRAKVKLTSAADSGVSGRGCQLDDTWPQSFSKVDLIMRIWRANSEKQVIWASCYTWHFKLAELTSQWTWQSLIDTS